MKRAALFMVFACACGSSQVEPGSSMSQPGSDASTNPADNSDGAALGIGDGAPNHPPPAIGSTIVTVEIADGSGTGQVNVPVTFGQVFRQGDVPKGATLAGRIGADSVAMQVDAKATYSDGSLRHAVLTAVMPSLTATASKLELVSTAAGAPGTPLSSADLLGKNFDAAVELAIGGTTYRASAADLLRKDATHTWLSGPLQPSGESPRRWRAPQPRIRTWMRASASALTKASTSCAWRSRSKTIGPSSRARRATLTTPRSP